MDDHSTLLSGVGIQEYGPFTGTVSAYAVASVFTIIAKTLRLRIGEDVMQPAD
jgi:hypothetical protein